VRVGRELRVVIGVQDQAEHLLNQLIGPQWDDDFILLLLQVQSGIQA
jgi:hypothetical protein